PRFRDRPDDGGHEPGAVVEHPTAGRRRDGAGAAPRARGGVGAGGAAAGVLRDAAVAARDLAASAALTTAADGERFAQTGPMSIVSRVALVRLERPGPDRAGRRGLRPLRAPWCGCSSWPVVVHRG